jgi:hypothetical protein
MRKREKIDDGVCLLRKYTHTIHVMQSSVKVIVTPISFFHQYLYKKHVLRAFCIH